LAQWCCGIRGEDGVRFRDLTNFWIRLLNNVGKTITDEQLLPNLHFFYSAISDLQEPDMLLIQWLSELDKRLSLQETLSMSTEMPEEKQAIDSMLSACGDGKPLEGVCVNDFAGCGPNTNRMSLNTLHSSKGLQFDVVIIPGLEEGRLPSWGAQSIEAVSEARRTFYVGFTRARYLVYLLYSGWYQNQYGRVFDTGPSRFVLELQEALSS
jgi:DNA helicase-2/ATP-dependent DNA helicase PcrA